MRVATDMGGTFTDLVVEDEAGLVRKYKHSTTPSEPLRGVFGALELAASDLGLDLEGLLARTETFIHGTTRALNAILTGGTARTALLVTEGHPDILLLREGGRAKPFDFEVEYPPPFIPRWLTFEVPGRIGADGTIVRPLDEDAVRSTLARLRDDNVEAVAVCLLWSVVNPVHERRLGQLLTEELPGVPFTLSHELNPIVREFRRASSTAIDAALKPLMRTYLHQLQDALAGHAFTGRLLINTSGGGVQDAALIAGSPVHTINSGPAMAPVAGRYYANTDGHTDLAIVADTGGTSYDVSLVRRNRIPVTKAAWIGPEYFGTMTGFPAVDVRSVGAGGGSIAWVDAGGMLRVGPRSAGAEPGPVCYGRGGTEPTVTDACLVLGYIDPQRFLDGRMLLDRAAARAALRERVADPLGLELIEAAAAVLTLATERMVGAIEEITLNQGIAPSEAVLVGGGGAAGFNTVAIARRLGCKQVIIPALGAVLSASGALMSDLRSEYAATLPTSTRAFDYDGVAVVLEQLKQRCAEFAAGPGAGAIEVSVELFAEARYPHQVWDLEVPLRTACLANPAEVEKFRADFHAVHRDVFAIDDPESDVEVVAWRARVSCALRHEVPRPATVSAGPRDPVTRSVHVPGSGLHEVMVYDFDRLAEGTVVQGPAIVESAVTTVVIDPGAAAYRTSTGSLLITLSETDDEEKTR